MAVRKDLFWEISPLEILLNITWQYSATMHMKVKVKLTLEQAMKAQRRSSSTLSLTLALDGVGVQPHAPAALPLGKRCGTHGTRGWVIPRVDLDRCGKSRPHRDSIPGPSSP